MKTFNEEEFRNVLEEMILADLKHSQLLFGLSSLGLDPMDNHYLGICDLIACFIGVVTDEEKDRFMEIYMAFMNRSSAFPLSSNEDELRQIGKECLEELIKEFDLVYLL